MSKTMEQYSAMAAKGKALVDAFYPSPSPAASASSASGGVSLSSDEKTFRGVGRGSDRDTQRSRSHFLHWEGEEEGDKDTPEVVSQKLTEGTDSDSELVSQLRQELHRVQVGSLTTIASLRSRLAWYADNQVRERVMLCSVV
jgi:hypothetical protein